MTTRAWVSDQKLRRCSHRAPECRPSCRSVVRLSCVDCSRVKSGSTGQATTSSDESAPAWASSGEGDVDEARYRDVLGHSSTGVTRLTARLSRRYSGNERTI